MKEFLDKRNSFIINNRVGYTADIYNDHDKVIAIFNSLKEISTNIEDHVDFLIENIDEIEVDVKNLMDIMKNRISYLTSAIVHIGKLKMSYPAIAKEGDIKLVDLTKGSYDNISYSHTDSGLIMNATTTTLFME
ncbi:MAG: hypothetical protein DRQ78_00840 [Epsilonproteobacteria bacterium]|nr:MAG: hypothetical protein DRQ78_00840 [Campylobacterota bacterium]